MLKGKKVNQSFSSDMYRANAPVLANLYVCVHVVAVDEGEERHRKIQNNNNNRSGSSKGEEDGGGPMYPEREREEARIRHSA